jgi:hypothetical protein
MSASLPSLYYIRNFIITANGHMLTAKVITVPMRSMPGLAKIII